ncbi:MAG: tRNA (adenine-N1)-methyltransferase [Candidatus Thermoplasmatota archaeon]|nr:tRNA (adenine-N1)-methyltransferase [Candidatus Thermoplasmatota archaeon]
MSKPKTVQNEDTVALVDEKQRVYLIDTRKSTDKFKGVGVFNPSSLIDQQYGSQKTIGSKSFFLLPVSISDALTGLKRKAQIILPKDSAQIIIHCSITPGKTVLEAGVGSGSLTTVLASMVGETGNVISYDTRQDFIDHAKKNLTTSQLLNQVTLRLKDVTKGVSETDLDAVILDIPNPWAAIAHVWNALTPGGYLCTYSPLISQVEQSVEEIRKHPFINIKTIETIEREMIVGDRGTRPSFNMLGHTGYLTFARKIKEEKNDKK